MTKELEALNEIEFKLDTSPYRVDSGYIKEELDLLKKYLTPPTLEDVIQAIKNEIDDVIEVLFDDYIFSVTTKEGYSLISEMQYEKIEFIGWKLSPHLVEMIGRFYKGVKH